LAVIIIVHEKNLIENTFSNIPLLCSVDIWSAVAICRETIETNAHALQYENGGENLTIKTKQ
jgi:hypothetical protein